MNSNYNNYNNNYSAHGGATQWRQRQGNMRTFLSSRDDSVLDNRGMYQQTPRKTLHRGTTKGLLYPNTFPRNDRNKENHLASLCFPFGVCFSKIFICKEIVSSITMCLSLPFALIVFWFLLFVVDFCFFSFWLFCSPSIAFSRSFIHKSGRQLTICTHVLLFFFLTCSIMLCFSRINELFLFFGIFFALLCQFLAHKKNTQHARLTTNSTSNISDLFVFSQICFCLFVSCFVDVYGCDFHFSSFVLFTFV